MVEFYLKILSGNHIGAEIPLEPGRYSLGRDENCDLVLSDASINEIELIIEISDEGQLQVQTSTADEPLYLNGEPVGSGTHCNPFDVVTSSGLFFAMGPSEVSWPDIALPELNRPEPEEVPEKRDADPEGSGDDAFPDAEIHDTDVDVILSMAENPETISLAEDDDHEDEEDNNNPLENINKKWLIAAPTILIAFFIVILAVTGGTTETHTPEISYLSQAQQVQQILKLKDIVFKELPNKTIMISGYVSTNKKKRELQRLLRERGVPFNIQVVAMNEMRSNADILLKGLGYKNLLLEPDTTQGSLVLTGYIATADELNRLETTLMQEIHGLISVVDQVENQSGRMNTLKSMLREKKLSARIHLVERPGKVSLQGNLLDEGQVYNLQELVKRFRDRYGDNPALEIATKSANSPFTTTKASNGPSLPSLNIRGISMGRVPYVVMDDGSKYLIGAKLANGYIIEDINIEYLLLTNGIDRIKYRLGGNRGGQ